MGKALKIDLLVFIVVVKDLLGIFKMVASKEVVGEEVNFEVQKKDKKNSPKVVFRVKLNGIKAKKKEENNLDLKQVDYFDGNMEEEIS